MTSSCNNDCHQDPEDQVHWNLNLNTYMPLLYVLSLKNRLQIGEHFVLKQRQENKQAGLRLNIKTVFPGVGISIIKIRGSKTESRRPFLMTSNLITSRRNIRRIWIASKIPLVKRAPGWRRERVRVWCANESEMDVKNFYEKLSRFLLYNCASRVALKSSITRAGKAFNQITDIEVTTLNASQWMSFC